MYLLDTNVCIVYLNQRSSGVRQRLEQLKPDDIRVCSPVKAELYYGAMRSRNVERSLAIQMDFLNKIVSLPFDDEAARMCGRLRADLASLGTPMTSGRS